MEKETLFVVGDVHGEFALLEQLLVHWQPDKEQLVFVGDLIDRGPQGKDCLLLAQKLVDSGQAVCLLGNHEDILLQWLADPEENLEWYLRNGGEATIDSLLHPNALTEYSASEAAGHIRSRYPELINFLQERPLYYETPHYIVVHAGINTELPDWHDTSRRDFLWIREPFHNGVNRTGKTILFGHTPTPALFGYPGVRGLWQHDHKIGLDGGAVYSGVLHGVVCDAEGIQADYVVPHPEFKETVK